MNPKISYKLEGIMMCQCWLIPGNKCTILVSDDDEGDCVFSGLGIYGQSLYHPLDFVINLKLH